MRLRSAVLCLMCALFLPVDGRADYLSDRYIVPVVARNQGVAGSTWRTELCISNFNSGPLTLHLKLSQKDDSHGISLTVQPSQAKCSADFILEWFGLTEFQGALLVYPETGMNPGLGTIRYPLSTRVYNITDDGTYGLSVTATPLIQVDWTMYDEFAASGLHHFGTPGVSGFRSSVGVFNHTKAVQRVQMTVYDAEGLEVWEREEELDMGQQVQYLLPQSLEAVGCSAVFINWGHETLGTGMIYPYITVTDNATGDGRFINASQYWGP